MASRRTGRSRDLETEPWRLRLYVMGDSPKNKQTKQLILRVCRDHLPTGSSFECIDINEDPKLADVEGINAVPMLVREVPSPERKIIGHPGTQDQLLRGLGLSASL